jgi:hypothetical protein
MNSRPELHDPRSPSSIPESGEHAIAESKAPTSGAFPLHVEGPLDNLEDAWFSEKRPASTRSLPVPAEPATPIGDSVADRWFR